MLTFSMCGVWWVLVVVVCKVIFMSKVMISQIHRLVAQWLELTLNLCVELDSFKHRLSGAEIHVTLE